MTNHPIEISVVCPFYNEAGGIEHAMRQMVLQLSRLDSEWELILVNDGSTDASFGLAANVAEYYPRVRVLGYPDNRGRGHALRAGLEEAHGEIVVTTELDLSWGENIVHELVRYLRENQLFDIVVASPHLEGGGFRNIPAGRVWLSRLGNLFIRACLPGAVATNTGMTRAYRRRAIRALPLYEDGKEFHVEVIAKAHALGLSVLEIPAELAWQSRDRGRRRSKWSLVEMSLGHIGCVVKACPAQVVCMMGLGALLLAFAALVMEPLFIGAPEVATPFSLSLFLFRASLVLLASAIPLAWLGGRTLRNWRRQSNAQLAAWKLGAGADAASRLLPPL